MCFSPKSNPQSNPHHTPIHFHCDCDRCLLSSQACMCQAEVQMHLVPPLDLVLQFSTPPLLAINDPLSPYHTTLLPQLSALSHQNFTTRCHHTVQFISCMQLTFFLSASSACCKNPNFLSCTLLCTNYSSVVILMHAPVLDA